MKIVEFGEDGSPRLLKQGGAAQAAKARDEVGSGPRETAVSVPSLGRTRVEIDTARIKIREFGMDAPEETVRRPSQKPPGVFGAARAPQSIKIVDFDKAGAKAEARATQSQDRPRGMKIVETE